MRTMASPSCLASPSSVATRHSLSKLGSALAAPSVLRHGNDCSVFFENVSEEQKHRTSLHKTSVLLRQNLRTFAQRSPMFLGGN